MHLIRWAKIDGQKYAVVPVSRGCDGCVMERGLQTGIACEFINPGAESCAIDHEPNDRISARYMTEEEFLLKQLRGDEE